MKDLKLVAVALMLANVCYAVNADEIIDASMIDKILVKYQMSPTERAWTVVLRNGRVVKEAHAGTSNDVDAANFYYEPGSVIKPFTAAIGLTTKTITSLSQEYSTMRDDKNYFKLPGDGVHSFAEKMSVAEALVRSSNVVFGKLGSDIGASAMYSGLSAFGFGGGDAILMSSEKWNKVIVNRIPIGQGMTASLLQIARAYDVIFNDGRDLEGRQVVSCAVANQVLNALERVATKDGTAQNAAVDGVVVAGKTGTSQRCVGEKYMNLYNATFVGGFKNGDDRFVVAVMYECEKNSRHQGGDRPAHAFHDICKFLLGRK